MLMRIVEVGAMIVVAFLVGYGLTLFAYFIVVGKCLMNFFFRKCCIYIRDHGQGNDIDINNKVIDANLTMRKLAIFVTVSVMAIPISIGVGLLFRLSGSLALTISAGIGAAYGLYMFHKDAYLLECKVPAFVGKIIELVPDQEVAIFESLDNTKYKQSFADDPRLFKELEADKTYYVSDYIWQINIAATNRDEWPEGEW